MTTDRLLDALSREAEALTAGRLDALPALQEEKERLAERLKSPSEGELRQISSLARENARLLAIALDAARSARDRLDAARNAPARIGYAADGAALTTAHHSGKTTY